MSHRDSQAPEEDTTLQWNARYIANSQLSTAGMSNKGAAAFCLTLTTAAGYVIGGTVEMSDAKDMGAFISDSAGIGAAIGLGVGIVLLLMYWLCQCGSNTVAETTPAPTDFRTEVVDQGKTAY